MPRVDASADRYWSGRITRQGSPWLRWALIEAAMYGPRRPDRVGRWARGLAVRKGGLKARAAVAKEVTNIMAVWGTPGECIEKIKFYLDAMQPEQLMLNIASGSLPQEKVLQSMRLCAEEVLPTLHAF